jgi:hypothetical protein
MKKEKKEVKVTYKIRKSTFDILAEKAEKSKVSKVEMVEKLICSGDVFTQPELKEIRFALNLMLDKINDLEKLNNPLIAGGIAEQKQLINGIIDKTKNITE